MNALMPKQLGAWALDRTWQESLNGRISIESAAYDRPQRDEATIGVWLPVWAHNMHSSWLIRGEVPLLRHDQTFTTAQGLTAFDTAFYSDGITDSIAGNAFCLPESCIASVGRIHEGLNLTLGTPNFVNPGRRAVSIFFRIDRAHSSADQAEVFRELTAEATEFVAGVDFEEISRRFQ
jgi:hypothetical protein